MSLVFALWVMIFLTTRLCADLADVTLADEDTNSILPDNANRAIQGNVRKSYLVRKSCLERKSYLVKKVYCEKKFSSEKKLSSNSKKKLSIEKKLSSKK